MESKEYEVWVEGYITNGEHDTAHLLGKASAKNFTEACQIVMRKRFLELNPDKVNEPTPSDNWGLSLYPTEEQARKSFG